MFVRARVRMLGGVRGAGLNVSQQSLLISAEAVVEALRRQGCILRREGLPFERQGRFINSPPIYGQYPPCHTHTGPSDREYYHSILHGEKKRESFSDECYKDSNPVNGDTQPNIEMHLGEEVGG